VQPWATRVLLGLCCVLLCRAEADPAQPLVLTWQVERRKAPAPSPSIAFSNLHLQSSQNLLFISQLGTVDVNVESFSVSGQLLWERKFRPTPDAGFRIAKTAVDNEGNIIVAGSRVWLPDFGVDPGEDMAVMKLDQQGTMLWLHRFADNQSPPDLVEDLLLDATNNVYVSGRVNWDMLVAKLSPRGEVLWERRSGSATNVMEGGYAMALHPNGNLYAADRTRLFRYSTDGQLVWEKETGILQDTILISPRGTILTTARREWFSGESAELGEFDESGNLLWKEYLYDQVRDLIFAGGEKPLLAYDNDLLQPRKDGPQAQEYVFGPVSGISDVERRSSDGTFFVTGWNGVLQLRTDLSRAAFYHDPTTRFTQTPWPPNIVITSSNIFRAGLYQDNDRVMWTEIRAWGPTNSPALPTILEHPVGGMFLRGDDSTMSVRAADVPPGFELSYQWFRVDIGMPYELPGETNTILRLTNMPAVYISPPRPLDYFVRISNTVGTVFSREAELWVHTVPNLTTPPAPNPSLGYAGDRVVWSILTDATSPRFIQWYKDSVPIPGANSTFYVVTNLGPEHLGNYYVYISNTVGQSTSMVASFPILLNNVQRERLGSLRGNSIPLLRADGRGNVIAASTFSSNIGGGSFVHELSVAKYNAQGQLLWSTNADFMGNLDHYDLIEVDEKDRVNGAYGSVICR
jgi:hypothetical protein